MLTLDVVALTPFAHELVQSAIRKRLARERRVPAERTVAGLARRVTASIQAAARRRSRAEAPGRSAA